jgi:predicted nuclease of predicted toxin-antitoxin system
MKVVVDMNLSPDWVGVFKEAGWDSAHWSMVGTPSAPDALIMAWAREHGFVVFTHDLDFGALLAATGAAGPSVVQLRCEDTRPANMGALVLTAMKGQGDALRAGALMTIDPRRMRISILPLQTT